jgi:Flp pilus assembly pilin Flp
MLRTARRLIAGRDTGASALEYSLLVAAIATLAIVIAFALSRVVQATLADACPHPGSTTVEKCA